MGIREVAVARSPKKSDISEFRREVNPEVAKKDANAPLGAAGTVAKYYSVDIIQVGIHPDAAKWNAKYDDKIHQASNMPLSHAWPSVRDKMA